MSDQPLLRFGGKTSVLRTCTVIVSLAIIFAVTTILISSLAGRAQNNFPVFHHSRSLNPTFAVICIGAGGGPFQDNLSAYLIGVLNDSHPDSLPSKFGSFDGGTLLSGLQQADNARLFSVVIVPEDSQYTKAGYVLQLITQFFISHAHLDHIAGMIIDSTAMDATIQRGLVGFNSTLTSIQNYIFNNQIWANFANTGESPLDLFVYNQLTPNVSQTFPELEIQVTAYPIVHASLTSTAFLIYSPTHKKYLMYWGDVGPDSVQNVTNNRVVWQTVAPYVASGQLPAIIIECSFTNNRSDDQLYGHLTPKYLMQELHVLSDYVQAPDMMRNFSVMVAHIKPSIKIKEDIKSIISNELSELNDLGVHFIFPEVGYRYDF